MSLSRKPMLEGVIGLNDLNGFLVTVLCIAYFVLVACALSLSRAAELGDRTPEHSDNEAERVVAYARTTTDHETESRRVAQLIDATVLSMRHGKRYSSAHPGPIRGDGRPDASDRTCARQRSSRRGLRV